MAQSFHEQGGSAGTPAQLQIDPYHAVDSEALPDRVYIMQNVDTDVDVEELQQRIQLEPWFKAEGFDQRDGITLAGGSLLGVTTALATVKDKWGSEVGESGTLEDAERLIPFLPKEGEPYTAQVVWDSEEALNMSNALKAKKNERTTHNQPVRSLPTRSLPDPQPTCTLHGVVQQGPLQASSFLPSVRVACTAFVYEHVKSLTLFWKLAAFWGGACR